MAMNVKLPDLAERTSEFFGIIIALRNYAMSKTQGMTGAIFDL